MPTDALGWNVALFLLAIAAYGVAAAALLVGFWGGQTMNRTTRSRWAWVPPATIIAGLLVLVIMLSGASQEQARSLANVAYERDAVGVQLNAAQVRVTELLAEVAALRARPEKVCPAPLRPDVGHQTPLFDSEAHRILR